MDILAVRRAVSATNLRVVSYEPSAELTDAEVGLSDGRRIQLCEDGAALIWRDLSDSTFLSSAVKETEDALVAGLLKGEPRQGRAKK